MRAIYLILEFLVVWTICLIPGAIMTLGLMGINTLSVAIFIFYAIGSLGLAAKFTIFGAGGSSLLGGFYSPFRPVADIVHGTGLGTRVRISEIDIGYHDPGDMDPFEVLRRLAVQLKQAGIDHSHAGNLIVRDGGTHWRLEPTMEGSRITGWVDDDDRAHRDQVIAGVKDFMTQNLSLKLRN